MANALGNKSLNYSEYESFKKVKKTEKKHIAYILKALSKKVKTKVDERKKHLLESADRIANPLWQYLNMSLALKTWKRYLKIYDSVEKDEVDIDSGDFELSELEDKEEEERKRHQAKIGIASTLKNLGNAGAKRGSFLNTSKHSKNSKDNRGAKRRSTLMGRNNKVAPESRDQSNRPSLILRDLKPGTYQAEEKLNEAMDKIDKEEIQQHEETMKRVIQEDIDKDHFEKTYQ